MTLVEKAAVVGAGTMGGQIAQTIARAGIPVLMKDISQELVERGLQEARNVTAGEAARLVKRGRCTEQEGEALVEDVLSRITGTTSYEGFGSVDFVIEAVPERMEIKQAVFAELDAHTPSHAILASNTSSLSISEIARATLRPELVVGFHYFYPASLMPLIEVIEGERSGREAVAGAVAFAQAIRKQPIRCGEVPGFVVNRILTAGISEVYRLQEERSYSIKAIDEGIAAAGIVPVGPYVLVNLLGLDTVVHVAEHMVASYGPERFYVHEGMRKLVSEGRLGAKTGGDGVYDPQGNANLPGEGRPDIEELVELLTLKTFHEACLLLQEGVASHRDIDFGMMAGAGLDPTRGLLPPFLKADSEGLDTLLERLEGAAERYGERFAPPVILRRLVAQGRLGAKSGQGFYAYPGAAAEQVGKSVKLERREQGVAVLWLANGRMNSLSPQAIADIAAAYERVREGDARALVIASANPFLFCAGADIKAFTTIDASEGEALLRSAHALFDELGGGRIATVAAVNGIAFGGGCELAMACDLRLAASSALFGQPEIKLGIIPGFGGTQRLPRLVGEAKAFELNALGDPLSAEEAFAYGLVAEVVADHELFDRACKLARGLAKQAPLALGAVKRLTHRGLQEGLADEQREFAAVFASADAREGIAAFLARRPATFSGS
jgi:enoyl-CoA hydratase/3-hydroxyacyl-CoA dehydrogenase